MRRPLDLLIVAETPVGAKASHRPDRWDNDNSQEVSLRSHGLSVRMYVQVRPVTRDYIYLGSLISRLVVRSGVK
jgi:hypothetical protein